MRPGQVVGERFEIERHAASGGMGDVYRARDRATGVVVALKVSSADASEARFARESALMSKLSHRAIPRFVAAGAESDGRRFLALEWLEGEDLDRRLERGPLAVDDAVAIGRQVAGALAAAHDAGVVHRDIKPSNLFLRRGDDVDVVVLDFGVAYETSAQVRLTTAGAAVGTPNYMSPEQVRCEADIDARADVFALGAVLFECLLGRSPFQAERLTSVLMKILMDEAPRVDLVRADVPGSLGELVARMLSKRREDRPADGAALARELARIRAPTGPPVSVRAWGTVELAPMSIVMVGPPARDGAVDVASATLAPADVGDAELATFGDIARRHAGRLEVLPDGTRTLCFQVRSGSGPSAVRLPANAAEMAKAAVRAAFEIRSAAPATYVVVATGRGEKGARVGREDAFGRAAELLEARSLHAGAPGADDAGGIRADEATAELVARWTIAERVGASYVLRAAADPRRKSGASSAERTLPWTGRDGELETASDAFRAALHGGPRALLVLGEIGVGKSRFTSELAAVLAGHASTPRVWSAAADTFFGAAPFAQVGALIRSAAGVRPDDAPSVARSRLEAATGELRLAVFLGEACGVRYDDDAHPLLRDARSSAESLFDHVALAFTDWIVETARERPLVLILDDAASADPTSASLLGSALRWSTGLPLFAVATAYPDQRAALDGLAGGGATELLLEPLGEQAVRALAASALGADASDPGVDRIVATAAGNPLLVEELARPGARDGGVSATALALAEARLAELPDLARRTCRAASVIGSPLRASAVAVLLPDVPPVDLQGALDALERARVIRNVGHEGYRFENRLLRQASYDSFSVEDRKTAHRRVAESFAALATDGDAPAALVAEHFQRAGDDGLARAWLVRAAGRALEGQDLSRAIELGERSLSPGLAPPVAAMARLVLAEAYRWRGDFSRAAAHALAARDLCPRGSVAWLRATEEAVSAAGRRSDWRVVVELGRELSAMRPADGSTATWARGVAAAARYLFQAGQSAVADGLLALLLDVAATRADLDGRALAEISRLGASRARHRGDVAGDLRGYGESLRALERAGDLRGAANARVSYAFALIEVGDHAAAEATLRQAVADADRLGIASVATRARQNLSLTAAARGDLGRARALASGVIAEAAAGGDARFEGWTRVYLASFDLLSGDLAAAIDGARRATSILAGTPACAGALAILSRALIRSGRPEEALEPAREAMRSLDAFGGLEEFELDVRVAHVEAELAGGHRDRGAAALATAIARVHDLARALPEAARRTFLTAVPASRRLLELGEALGRGSAAR